jgi:hypothetical protein
MLMDLFDVKKLQARFEECTISKTPLGELVSPGTDGTGCREGAWINQ